MTHQTDAKMALKEALSFRRPFYDASIERQKNFVGMNADRPHKHDDVIFEAATAHLEALEAQTDNAGFDVEALYHQSMTHYNDRMTKDPDFDGSISDTIRMTLAIAEAAHRNRADLVKTDNAGVGDDVLEDREWQELKKLLVLIPCSRTRSLIERLCESRPTSPPDGFFMVPVAVVNELMAIDKEYDRQVEEHGYVDTPGGIEHKDDAFKLIKRLVSMIAAAQKGGV